MKQVVKGILAILFTIFFRVELINKENVPQKGAVLLCSNHVGNWDMFFIGYRVRRLVHYMAKEELFKNPLVGAVIRWLGAFPVKRGKADIESIKKALKLLKDGHIVGIFPEGTRRRKGKVQKVKPGAAMIAVRSSVPILPVAVEANYKPWGKIRIVFGKPFNLDIQKDKKYTREELGEISESIMKKVYGLLEER